ncbi:MAG: ABC transporter permease [Aeropyrum sp.]|nr:ABC transporter permease [Aeropyrum sp.]MCE4616659.1 ABC transporter permease [Aeropyrum sp.]
MPLGEHARIFATIVKAEASFRIMELKRNPIFTILSLVWPYLMLVSIYVLGTSYGSIERFEAAMKVDDPILFLAVASAIAFTAVGVIDYTTNSILWHRWLGTLPYVIMSTPSFTAYMIASGIVVTGFAIAMNYISISPLILVIGGFESFYKLMIIVGIALLGMVPLAGIAAVAGLLSIIVKEEGNVLGFLNPLLLLVSGVFYPIEILPRILALMSKLVPVTYLVETAKLVAAFQATEVKIIYIALYVFGLMAIVYNLGGGMVIAMLERHAQKRGVSM